MDPTAAPSHYAYAQPGAYPPYPYAYPQASAAWPAGFDPAMLPYPDPRMYPGGVPGYPMPALPPSAADFYAAAAVSDYSCANFRAAKSTSAQGPQTSSTIVSTQDFAHSPTCEHTAPVHLANCVLVFFLPYTSNLAFCIQSQVTIAVCQCPTLQPYCLPASIRKEHVHIEP